MTEFVTLISDLEISFPSGAADSETIHVAPMINNVAFDIVNTSGATVNLLACNAQKEKVESGEIDIIDAEMGPHEDSPFTTSSYNKTFIAPNFLRIKTDGVGAITLRLRGNR